VSETEIAIRTTIGCPQEYSLLSLVLWNFVIENHLKRLELHGYGVLGFVKDLILVVRGKVVSLISDWLQSTWNYTSRRHKLANFYIFRTIIYNASESSDRNGLTNKISALLVEIPALKLNNAVSWVGQQGIFIPNLSLTYLKNLYKIFEYVVSFFDRNCEFLTAKSLVNIYLYDLGSVNTINPFSGHPKSFYRIKRQSSKNLSKMVL
jgi:hypothetical protein